MVEKVVNLYSSEKLEEPINSEVYTSMEEARDRLVAENRRNRIELQS